MFIACSLTTVSLLAPDVLAVTGAGDIYRVDSSNGVATLVNSTALPMHCLARANDGRMWSLADTGGGLSRLLEIDVQSGGTSTMASINLSGVAYGASFDADGKLYVLVRPLGGGADRLARIDMDSFAMTDIGSTGLFTLEDLCIAPEGRIYAWDAGPGGANGIGLVELSRSNGAALDLAPAGGSSDVLALAIDEVGALRGANFKLYAIDRASGVDQATSPNTQVSIEGLQFLAGMSRLDGALALERTGNLKRVNTSTGAVGPVFGMLSGNLVAATYLPTNPPLGDYLVFRDLGTTTEVLSIDPSTGAATSLATTAFDDVVAAYFYRGPITSELWLVTDGGPGQPDQRRKVSYPAFQSFTTVPLTGFEDVLCVSTDFTGRHFGLDRSEGLFRFDLTILSVPADITPGPTALSGVTTSRHDPQGRLFAANGALQRVEVMAESTTPIGTAALGELIGLDFFSIGQLPAPSSYCTGSTNSLGCNTRAISTGVMHPSASEPAGFDVRGVDVLSDKQGLLFYGLNGRHAAPFSSGFLCVKSPLRRTPVQNSGGNGACTGTFSFDFNAWTASGADPALRAGVRVDAQYWSRDPAAPSTTNITNALEFVLAP